MNNLSQYANVTAMQVPSVSGSMTVNDLVAELMKFDGTLNVFMFDGIACKQPGVFPLVHRVDQEGHLYPLDVPAPTDSVLGIILS
jgi:hypothetical protein